MERGRESERGGRESEASGRRRNADVEAASIVAVGETVGTMSLTVIKLRVLYDKMLLRPQADAKRSARFNSDRPRS